MTDADLRKMPEFWGQLHVLNQGDDKVREILGTPPDRDYDGTVVEAADDARFRELMADAAYELKGAVRYSDADIRPVFWRKRARHGR